MGYYVTDNAGTDLMLVDLVEKGMKVGNLVTEVLTGRSMYQEWDVVMQWVIFWFGGSQSCG